MILTLLWGFNDELSEKNVLVCHKKKYYTYVYDLKKIMGDIWPPFSVSKSALGI